MTSTTTTISFIVARVLDMLAVLAAKLLPIAGAGVNYYPGTSRRLGLLKEQGLIKGASWVLQVGGWEAVVDLR